MQRHSDLFVQLLLMAQLHWAERQMLQKQHPLTVVRVTPEDVLFAFE
jgi:hypothetical protein